MRAPLAHHHHNLMQVRVVCSARGPSAVLPLLGWVQLLLLQLEHQCLRPPLRQQSRGSPVCCAVWLKYALLLSNMFQLSSRLHIAHPGRHCQQVQCRPRMTLPAGAVAACLEWCTTWPAEALLLAANYGCLSTCCC